jgi:hypothetical protein
MAAPGYIGNYDIHESIKLSNGRDTSPKLVTVI